MMNTRITLGLLTGLLTVLTGCSSRSGKKPNLAEIERIPRLETIAPERQQTFTVKREYTATIEPLEKAELYTQVRGVVQFLAPNADIGRHVRGESISLRAVGSGMGLLGTDPLLGTAALLAGRTEAEVLVGLAVPDVLAERDNKQALLLLAIEARSQASKAREVAAREVKEAQAQRKRYSAEVEYRALHHERMVRLVSTDTVQRQQAEEARLQHKSAVAAFEAAEAQILTKQARLHAADSEVLVAEAKIKVARAELDRLEAMVGFATIRAPFDGVVTKRWIDRGATAKDFGSPLLTVIRTDVVRVLIDVPERDVPYLRPASAPQGGNEVTLHVPVLRNGVTDGKLTGRVTLTAGALDPVTRTMRTEIWLANPKGDLKAQMTGTATVTLEKRTNVFTVPSSAIVRQGDKASVYCVVAETKSQPERGVVRRIEVQVGVDNGRVAEIRSGLKGGERIIAKGNGVVREGDFAVAVPAAR
jgi:RND family efflux transporter MFP subunit